jgi:replicase family protein
MVFISETDHFAINTVSVPKVRANTGKQHVYETQSVLCERHRPFRGIAGAADRRRWLLSDWEAQELIGTICGNDADFFYTNNSSLSLDELRDHFCTLMPSVGIQEEPKVLCGFNNNGEQRDVGRAINMRKINLQAIPWGRNCDERRWNLAYNDLPRLMAFDIDENKSPDFAALYPDYRCYEIFDALDIAPPLVTTINPVTLNCQYIYEIQWTENDRKNPAVARKEYDSVRKRLSLLFGGDPMFGNHVVRSPFYIAGHHRINPDQRTTSRKQIDVDAESLFHYSKWYDPHPYTLAELWGIVGYLEELHGTPVAESPAVETVYAAKTTTTPTDYRPNGNRLPINEQLAHSRREPTSVIVGERNVFIFSCAAVKSRRIAGTFRNNRDDDYSQRYQGFMAAVLPGILELNGKLTNPLDDKEVQASTASAVRYCLSDRYRPLGRTSEEATFINLNFRWKNHTSAETKARAMGISRRTYYRRGYHTKGSQVVAPLRSAIASQRRSLMAGCSFGNRLLGFNGFADKRCVRSVCPHVSGASFKQHIPMIGIVPPEDGETLMKMTSYHEHHPPDN